MTSAIVSQQTVSLAHRPVEKQIVLQAALKPPFREVGQCRDCLDPGFGVSQDEARRLAKAQACSLSIGRANCGGVRSAEAEV